MIKLNISGTVIILSFLFTACPLSPSDEGTAPPEGEAGTWFVDVAASPAGDGKTWGSAFQHPQQAVDAAISGEVVKVAQGSYMPRTTNREQAVIVMKPGVELYGGYLIENGEFSARDPEIYRSYLAGVWFDEEEMGSYRSVHVVLGASNAIIDGFCITDGDTCIDPEDPLLYTGPLENLSYWGGGMLNDHVEQLRIHNCHFISNRAEVGGGAICSESSDVDITRCQFWYNSVWRQPEAGMDEECWGGAIAHRDGGLLRIENSLFVANSAGPYYQLEGYGGAIAALSESTVRLLQCTLVNNDAGEGLSLFDEPEEPGEVPGTISVLGSILWFQSMEQDTYQIEAGFDLDVRYSDVSMFDTQALYPGTGNLNDDPLFKGGLAVSFEYFRLTLASPCFNVLPAEESTFDDLAGDVRNGADGWVQMGALENL